MAGKKRAVSGRLVRAQAASAGQGSSSSSLRTNAPLHNGLSSPVKSNRRRANYCSNAMG